MKLDPRRDRLSRRNVPGQCEHDNDPGSVHRRRDHRPVDPPRGVRRRTTRRRPSPLLLGRASPSTLLVCIDLASAMLAWTRHWRSGRSPICTARPSPFARHCSLSAWSSALVLSPHRRSCTWRGSAPYGPLRRPGSSVSRSMTGAVALILPRLAGFERGWARSAPVWSPSSSSTPTARGIYARWLALQSDEGPLCPLRRPGRRQRGGPRSAAPDTGAPGERVARGRRGRYRLAPGSAEIDLPWLGTIDDLPGIGPRGGGVIIAASALAPAGSQSGGPGPPAR